jgi:hypothetical protein
LIKSGFGSLNDEVVAENLPDVFSKLSLGADAAVVHDSRILERPGKEEEVATFNSGVSNVLSKDGAKVPDDAVEATAIDQAEGRFQSQILVAKVGDFKDGGVRVSGGEAQAVLHGRGAVVGPQNGKALASQPAADLTVSAAHIHDELIFRKPAGVDRFTEFLLRLVGFPEWANSGLSHWRSHLRRCRRCVQLGNTCSM